MNATVATNSKSRAQMKTAPSGRAAKTAAPSGTAKAPTADTKQQAKTFADKILGEREINLHAIDFSKDNPRKIFDEESLIEFGNSIREVGLIQAILVRPHPSEKNRFILVCGERRTRAHLAVGLTEIRAVIAEMTDEQVFNFSIHENLHRADLTAIEEADSYEHFLRTVKIGGEPLTTDELARRVCKPHYYVLNRLELCKLIEPAKDDLRRGLMTVGIALELAKLSPESQEAAYQYCYQTEYENGQYQPIKTKPVNLSTFKEKVRQFVMMALDKAPFPLDEEGLSDLNPACVRCPERSGANVLFAELAEEDLCLNKTCFQKKITNFVHIQRTRTAEKILVEQAKSDYAVKIAEAKTAEKGKKGEEFQIAAHRTGVLEGQLNEIEKFGAKCQFAKIDEKAIASAAERVLLLSASYYSGNKQLLGTDGYTAINSRGANCKYSETGVYGDGANIGKQQLFCRHKECKKHRRTSSSSSSTASTQTPEERINRKNELFEIRAAEKTRLKVITETASRIDDKELWSNPTFQRLICACLIELSNHHTNDHRLKQSAEILGISYKDVLPEKSAYVTDSDIMTIHDRLADRCDPDFVARLTYLLTVASFGENRYEGKVSQETVESLVELFGCDRAAMDAESRVELCRERPDYKKFLLDAEAYQKQLGAAKPEDRALIEPPVFFTVKAETQA